MDRKGCCNKIVILRGGVVHINGARLHFLIIGGQREWVGDMERETWPAKGVAFVNMLRYLDDKCTKVVMHFFL